MRWFGLALAGAMIFALTPIPAPARVHVGIFVNFAPPELPVYAQPVCPGDNYIWTPGYWAWDPSVGDYYWVPGTWVMPPEVGFLWTPGYWGWGSDGYSFNAGYWGPTVGFYGGIDYGFGYYGHGFDGGRWQHGHFFYNREVNNVNVSIVHNVYNARAIHEHGGVSRVSFNGGRGGVNARPTAREEAAAHQKHFSRVAAQTRHIDEARANRQLRASVNQGAPPIAATQKPNDFRGRGVMKTRVAGAVHTPAARTANTGVRRGSTTERANHSAAKRQTTAARVNHSATKRQATTARENRGAHSGYMPAARRSATPTRSNTSVQNRRQQQNQMAARQRQQRQQLQQRQNQERQQMQRQRANNAARQQMQQRRQQQTRQMAQRQTQQRRQVQRRQAPRPQPQRQESRPERKPH
ncbi:MAG: YXWGXW repeat-containing protein [Candidatus Acidiferrum sp.]